MKRLHRYSDGEMIGTALRLLPGNMADRIGHVDFLTRTDPNFVGLHKYTDAGEGYRYCEVAHIAFPSHQRHRARSERVTTVVLPVDYAFTPKTILHELGHALDRRNGFGHRAAPVSSYALTNRGEAFAEAFAAWCLPPSDSFGWAKADLDAATIHLFEDLAA